jgi:hypothetical protein
MAAPKLISALDLDEVVGLLLAVALIGLECGSVVVHHPIIAGRGVFDFYYLRTLPNPQARSHKGN